MGTRMSGLVLETLESRVLLSGYGDDYGDYTWNATPIYPPGTKYGYIGDYSYDTDMFSFYAIEGAAYGFSANCGTLSSIRLTLLDGLGYTISTDSNYYSGSAMVFYTAPLSGTRYLRVETPGYYTGSYSLNSAVVYPSDDHGDTAGTATNISTNAWINGDIEVNYDKDYFRFYAQEGFKYTIETQTGTLTDTFLWLYDTNGTTVIAGDDDSGGNLSSKVEWTATSSGYRYCAVERSYSGNDATGTYKIRVHEIDVDDYGDGPSHSSPLALNTMVMPKFETGSDIDCFSFNAIANQEYIVRLSSSTDVAPALTLRDVNGNTILFRETNIPQNDMIEVIWKAPKNGLYYLEANPCQNNAFEPTTYCLSITEGIADWTFMLYIAADNNLESFLSADVEEMIDGIIQGSLNTKINFIIQSDGNTSDVRKYWSSGTHRSTLTPVMSNHLIGEKNMGNPATLNDFIDDSMELYPANNYALILWDHGGQFLGACSDDTSSGDILTMEDFTQAFTGLNDSIDIIGFNACLMAGMEPSYQMRNAGEIYIGSEPSEYGNIWEGSVWNYAKIFEYLFSNPSVSPISLAGVIVQSYKELFGSATMDAISAIDLNIVDEIADGINALSGYLLNNAPRKSWEQVNTARQNALVVAPETEVVYGDLCDLGQFMREILKTATDTTLKSYAQQVLDNLLASIVDEWHDSNLAGATGMTIYLPELGSNVIPLYNQKIDFLRDTQWDEFVQIFVSGNYPDNDNTPPSKPNLASMDSSSDTGNSDHDGITKDNTPTLCWLASSDGVDGSGVAGYQWRVDSGLWSQTAAGLAVTVGPLADGSHIFYIRAEDNAGNISEVSEYSFVIDTTPPMVTFVTPTGKVGGFDHLDVSFSEAVDGSYLDNMGISLYKPEKVVFSDDVVWISENTYRAGYTISEDGGTYSFLIGQQVRDLAGNVLAKEYNGEIILPMRAHIGLGVNKLTYYDRGSLVTVQIASGTADVILSGDGMSKTFDKKGAVITGHNVVIENIAVYGTEKTTLNIVSKNKNNDTVLGGVTGSTLGKLNAKGIDLADNIDLSGSLGSLVVDDILDDVYIFTYAAAAKGSSIQANHVGSGVDFDFEGTITKFQANSFNEGCIRAWDIGAIAVKSGDFGVDVEARTGSIASISTVGNISGKISASGVIKKVAAKSGDITGVLRAGNEISSVAAVNLDDAIISAGIKIGTVAAKGDILDSWILGGYDIGCDCTFGGVTDRLAGGEISSVSAKGTFARSYIAAGTLPNSALTDTLDGVGQAALSGRINKVKFGVIDYNNANNDFGLYAANYIQPFKIGGKTVESEGRFKLQVVHA